jgi:MOSC domain-containing protein YiiM
VAARRRIDVVGASKSKHPSRYPVRMPKVLSVNVARPRENPDPRGQSKITGIYKRPTTEAVMVRAPGPMHGGLGSGLVGDTIGNPRVHGGDDQAVYAYAREDLDDWETKLDRTLTDGMFGENLTVTGIDVTGARIGERWRVGSEGAGGPLLEVSGPRTPCRTFAAFLDLNHLIKTFLRAAIPGADLRVIEPGTVRAGDEITIEHRPDHDVTVELVFRARLTEPELLPKLLVVDALSPEMAAYARRRLAVNEG